MALYIPHSIFPFGAAFICQAGNFLTLLRTYIRKYNSAMNLIKKLCLGAEWIILAWSLIECRASLSR